MFQGFFLLRIDGNRGFVASLSCLHTTCNVFKLGITVRMLFAFKGLPVCL